MSTGLTLEMAQIRYMEYLEAERAVLTSQSYTLSSGEVLTRANLAEIRKGLDYWEAICIKLNNGDGIGIYPVDVKVR